MQKAYDTFLQSEVPAGLAARSGGFEPYRYICAHCGEEVRLAAAGSISVVAHFRHHDGNNNVDCENYLGQYGAISGDYRSRRSGTERVEFYFDSNTKIFSLGLCFNENEIATYANETADFELRVSVQDQAFLTLRINNINFLPDTPKMIPIDRFSYSYYLSNTLNKVKRRYEFLKKDGLPTFFKIQGNDSEYRARLVRSTILYTDVPYFMVIEAQRFLPLPGCVKITDTYRFETMGRRLLGQVLTIKSKSTDLESLFALWGYQVEASETLTLLWPPAAQVNEISTIHKNSVFLFSSFNLEPHGNINVHSTDIAKIGEGVSRVSVDSKIKVFRKNAEIIVDKELPYTADYTPLPVKEDYANVYTVPDNGAYYLFNRSGTMSISEGQTVPLTPSSFIKHYKSGYLDAVFYPAKQNELSGKLLLDDLLMHYKRTENFSLDFFATLDISNTAWEYIKECIKTGFINSAAKRFIEKGRI